MIGVAWWIPVVFLWFAAGTPVGIGTASVFWLTLPLGLGYRWWVRTGLARGLALLPAECVSKALLPLRSHGDGTTRQLAGDLARRLEATSGAGGHDGGA